MSNNSQNNLQDLRKCTVAILNPNTGNVLGTAVIVTDDGLIVTCCHVIEDKKTKSIIKNVDIDFPSIQIKGNANVLGQYCQSELDIAFLQLQEQKLPGEDAVANLSESIEEGHKFKSFGFRKPLDFKGLHSAGEIRGKVVKERSNKYSQELIQVFSNEIGSGMSGAPIFDKNINRVIAFVFPKSF